MERWRDLSDYVEEPLSDASSCHEHISDLNDLPSDEAAPPGYGYTGGAPLSFMGALNTEVVPSVFPRQLNASGICTHESICPTESVSGLGGVDTPDDSSDSSDCSIEHKSLIDSNGHIQDNRMTTVYSTVALTPVILTADPLRPLSALSDSLSDISAVTEPLPDLYIFESESETREFVPSPCDICPFEPLPLPWETESAVDCKTPASTSCHHGPVDPSTEVGTAVAPACEGKLTSASDANQDSAEVGIADGQSDSPSELWLDTCQYLPWQDTGSRGDGNQASLDDRGHSQMEEVVWASGDSSFPPEVTGVSDYLPGDDDLISWSSGDTVERWSSVDSWASALSDWAAIIAAPPGDISAAFTEIGAEIEALTQALEEQSHPQQDTDRQQSHLQQDTDRQQSHPQQDTDRQQSHPQQTHMLMAIWDQPLKPQSSIESLSSSSLSEAAEPSGTQTEEAHRTAAIPQDGVEAVGIRSTSDERCLLSTASETALCPAMSDCPGETSVLPSSAVGDGMPTHQPHIAASVGGMDTDLYTRNNHEELVLLHITEEAEDGMKLEESFGDGWCQVTESPSVSQPGRSAKQGGERGCASSLSVSGFNRYQADVLKVEVEGEGSEGSRPLTGLRDLTPEDEPAHEPAVAASSALHRSAHELKECDQPGQDELQWGVPQFIVPLAPLTITQPLLCQTNATLEIRAERSVNDNCCHDVQPQELWPTFEGINETPLESCEDKQLIYIKKSTATCADEYLTDDGKVDLTLHTDQSLNNSLYDRELHSEDNSQCFPSDKTTNAQEIQELSRELSNLVVVPLEHFLFSEKESIAYITLDLNDPLFLPRPITTKAIQSDQSADQPESNPNKASEMPHKKSTAECRSRSKKDKPSGFHHGGQASKKQDNGPHHTPTQQPSKIQDSHVSVGGALPHCNSRTGHEGKENGSMGVLGPTVVAERVTTQPLGKKKNKHSQNAALVKSEAEPQAEEESGAKQKTARGKSDTLEPTLSTKAGKTKDKAPDIPIKNDSAQTQSSQKKAQLPVIKARQGTQPPCEGIPSELPSATQLNDDVIKRRRLSENKFGKMVSAFEAKLAKEEGPVQAKRVEHKAGTETFRKKAYSEVVKQKTHTHVEEPKVVQPIQSSSVSGDPQSLCLWCQFSAVSADNTVTWSREGTVLAEIKRSSGDESRVSVTIAKASHKDLGKYRCCLSSQHGSVTLDYVLTYEVLSEIVIPASSKPLPPAPVEVEVEEEDVHFSRLLFREDFLSEQYFGENQPASIVTEKAHFGEGMHRKAFRAKLQAGLVPKLSPGHPCVLKVHNSISYGTNNNEELVQKNFNLAVEECQVQNTAREYIKAYNNVARTAESFGEVPIIIPIYLVHRPSNDIPYATLEEELIGDFVKYSVRDGKEINLMRRNSEAGQKCCTFQHWVYQKTDGNLLVTDMQGVGMKLTDVGIATSKKGYKGFRGNCATSFIDQFKALHQCNMYCELLSLMSLQPKPKRPVGAPKPKTQCPAAPKKKTFGPTVKGKS